MSASSVARWNAIPLEYSNAERNLLKRPREDDPMDEGNDDDDDDISIVSRSPLPPPADAMDVDHGIDKYDEYVPGTAREVVTVETRIKPTNKGFALLAKLGWSEGQPLGLSSDARVDPIPFHMKSDSTGIGKISQDVRMIETTVSQRRELDSERQQRESEEQRKAREDAAARKSALQEHIFNTLKAFYCALCDKQFKNVSSYDEHTNSYAHAHKARAADLHANVRIKPKEELDKRKEKERKREEKELRKIAAANGIKMAKSAAVALPLPLSADVSAPSESLPSSAAGNLSPESAFQSGARKSAWSSVSSAISLQQAPIARAGAWASASSDSSTAQSGFRTRGWTSLDSTDHSFTPPATIPLPPSPPPPIPPTSNSAGSAAGWSSITPGSSAPPPPPDPSRLPTIPTPPASNSTSVPAVAPSKAHTSRMGWQKFQASNVRRR